jgi:hypothetical protein
MRRCSHRGPARQNVCGVLGPRKIRARDQQGAVCCRHVQRHSTFSKSLSAHQTTELHSRQMGKKACLQGDRTNLRLGIRFSQARKSLIHVDFVLARGRFTERGHKRQSRCRRPAVEHLASMRPRRTPATRRRTHRTKINKGNITDPMRAHATASFAVLSLAAAAEFRELREGTRYVSSLVQSAAGQHLAVAKSGRSGALFCVPTTG